MDKPLVLIFGDDEKAIKAFAETVADPSVQVGHRFFNQLLPNHIENAEKVYMLQDNYAVRAAYGDKAVLVGSKNKPETSAKTDAKKGTEN